MTELTDGLHHLLPPSAALLMERIGLTETLLLVEHYGGTAVWIPKKPKAGHAIAEAVSPRALAALCKWYGDTALEVPLCHKVLARLKDRTIAEEAKTLTDRQLARKYQLTERTIRNIRARAATGMAVKCDRTLDIFNDILSP